MTDLKKALMVVFGLAFLSLTFLVLVIALDAPDDLHEFFSFMTIMLFVSASLFGILRLVKGDIETQELYRTTPIGLVAVSIIPLSVLVAIRTSDVLIKLVMLSLT